VLPRYTAPAQYLAAITRDQNGNGVMAEDLTGTVANGNQQQITADLDLRTPKAANTPCQLHTSRTKPRTIIRFESDENKHRRFYLTCDGNAHR
jgi:hypothetical protein